MNAINLFHSAHPDMALELNVTRYPYSFIGNDKPKKERSTWHEGLLRYCNNDPDVRDQAEIGMSKLGKDVGIKFDFMVESMYPPVNAQRLLLWAGRFGLQEPFMTAINKRHFEQRECLGDRPILMSAVEEVGLDVAAAEAFLDTDELVDTVRHWYDATIHQKGIHSIPLFCFHVPTIDAGGGPFRKRGSGGEAYIINGSMHDDYFLQLFEVILRDVEAGKRVYDQQAAPYARGMRALF